MCFYRKLLQIFVSRGALISCMLGSPKKIQVRRTSRSTVAAFACIAASPRVGRLSPPPATSQ
jgi:hypothetical protein